MLINNKYAIGDIVFYVNALNTLTPLGISSIIVSENVLEELEISYKDSFGQTQREEDLFLCQSDPQAFLHFVRISTFLLWLYT